MASSDSFVHLHVHTEYSMLDGAARVTDLMTEAVAQGMPAIAITDHGNNFGAYDFWKQATAAGIKPIIGTEAYLTPGTHRSERTRVKWGNGGEDDVSGIGRVHPHHAAGRVDRPACTTCSGCRRWPRSRATTTSRGWIASC